MAKNEENQRKSLVFRVKSIKTLRHVVLLKIGSGVVFGGLKTPLFCTEWIVFTVRILIYNSQ